MRMVDSIARAKASTPSFALWDMAREEPENRHGLLVYACLTLADGHGKRVAALHMIEPRAGRPQAITLGAKAYDAEDFVNELRSMRAAYSAEHKRPQFRDPRAHDAYSQIGRPSIPPEKLLRARSTRSARSGCSMQPLVRGHRPR